MHRSDNSNYLLYIEPKKEDKLKDPINDSLTELMEMALSKAQRGTSSYSDLNSTGIKDTFRDREVPSFRSGSGFKGSHRTDCGERSSNCDFLLENGMITNSLAPFYLRWYRYSIPESEMLKLKKLEEFYNKK